MPRIVSTGELQRMLRRFAELPETGVGFQYRRLPQTITRQVYEQLDATGQGYYVPGEPVPSATTKQVLNGEAMYLTYVLPPGSYEAWMVSS